MIGRRRAVALLGAAAALPATRVEAKRRRTVTAASLHPTAWTVRLGGAAGLRYDLDFRRGEMGAPLGAFNRQRGIRLTGSAQGQVTFTGVGVPHVVRDEAVDLALECAGILTVSGGPTRWACEVRVSLGGG